MCDKSSVLPTGHSSSKENASRSSEHLLSVCLLSCDKINLINSSIAVKCFTYTGHHARTPQESQKAKLLGQEIINNFFAVFCHMP